MSFSATPNFGRPVHDPDNPKGIFQAMVGFLRHMRARGNTDQTVFGYERYLRDFIAWCDVTNVKTPEDVDTVVLERYLAFVQSLKVATTGLPLSWLSKEAKLVPVRSFFRWLKKSKRLSTDPAEDLRLVRRSPRPPVRPLSPEETQLLLDHPDIEKASGVRDRTMLEVLFATGIRRMELAQLRIEDIDFAAAILTVRSGKGGKPRYVPVARSALGWITQHLETAGLTQNSTGFLFPTRRGTPFNLSWLSTMIGDHVHRATGRRAGACHLLRHTMATQMLENGADSRVIQELLGHEHLSTTQIYTHVSIKTMQEVYARAHPSTRVNQPPLVTAPKIQPVQTVLRRQVSEAGKATGSFGMGVLHFNWSAVAADAIAPRR